MSIALPSFAGFFTPSFGGGGGSSYDPTVDNATMWVRADDPDFASFTDGTAVQSWRERGSTADDWDDNGVSSFRPTWKASGPNGKPYIQFAAGKQLIGPRTSLIVAPGGAGFGCIFVVKPNFNGSGSGGWSDAHMWGDGDDRFVLNSTGANKFEVAGYNTGSVIWGSAYTLNQWYIVAMWGVNGTGTAKIAVNNAMPVSGDMGSALSVHNANFGWGRDVAFAEAIGWNTNVGQTLIETYVTALNNKYATF